MIECDITPCGGKFCATCYRVVAGRRYPDCAHGANALYESEDMARLAVEDYYPANERIVFSYRLAVAAPPSARVRKEPYEGGLE